MSPNPLVFPAHRLLLITAEYSECSEYSETELVRRGQSQRRWNRAAPSGSPAHVLSQCANEMEPMSFYCSPRTLDVDAHESSGQAIRIRGQWQSSGCHSVKARSARRSHLAPSSQRGAPQMAAATKDTRNLRGTADALSFSE